MLNAILLLAVVAGLSAVLTGAVRAYALRRNVIDHPNERSSHTVPTPRGGGLGLVMALTIAVFYLRYARDLRPDWLIPVLAGSLTIALLGFIDDRINVNHSVHPL